MPKETWTKHPLSTGTNREGTGLRAASRHGKTAVLQLSWAWQTQREVPFHLLLCLTSCPAHWSCLPWTPYQQQQNMSVCTSVCEPASCQGLSDERHRESTLGTQPGRLLGGPRSRHHMYRRAQMMRASQPCSSPASDLPASKVDP